jgi:hypothetical protein
MFKTILTVLVLAVTLSADTNGKTLDQKIYASNVRHIVISSVLSALSTGYLINDVSKRRGWMKKKHSFILGCNVTMYIYSFKKIKKANSLRKKN